MKKWAVVISIFALIVSFQNCSKHQSDPSLIEKQEPVNYNKFSTEGADHLVMWDMQHQQFLDLNLNNGKMIPVEKYGDQPISSDTYCLSAQELQQVTGIISQAEICEPIANPNQLQKVCTQVYTYPYATLASQDAEVRLGEKIDGCSVPTDLCGSKAQELKDFVGLVVGSINQRVCP